MHTACGLIFGRFDSPENPLGPIINSGIVQARYLYSYLVGINAHSFVLEGNYFDRDYLEEFSEFYSLSSRGYPNICRRVHYFSTQIDRDVFSRAAAENPADQELLANHYLGFIVLRPIDASPLGRTVLKWYPDTLPERPRVSEPSREYRCTVAGIELSVNGLAWQQQDSGVAACATIGLWTILHSSAFDDWHAIPTTAQITKAAHNKNSHGTRIFPSHYLTMDQLIEAIKEMGLAPMILKGNMPNGAFSVERFSSSCSALLRSGYPLLITGVYTHESCTVGHVVCAVGFRQEPNQPNGPMPKMLDDESKVFYIHDDNIGPNVRFVLKETQIPTSQGNSISCAVLEKIAPNGSHPDDINSISFLPSNIVIAVHEDIRISILHFQSHAANLTNMIYALLGEFVGNPTIVPRLSFTTRFFKLADYLSSELKKLLASKPEALSRARMFLHEGIIPMSHHLAVVRITNTNEDGVIMDVLFDTTGGDRDMKAFAHVLYDNSLTNFLQKSRLQDELGTMVSAY